MPACAGLWLTRLGRCIGRVSGGCGDPVAIPRGVLRGQRDPTPLSLDGKRPLNRRIAARGFPRRRRRPDERTDAGCSAEQAVSFHLWHADDRLRPRHGAPACTREQAAGRGTAPGRLYDLGAFPGAVETAAAGARIHGQVVRLGRPERTLPWLDSYEGCGESHPEPHAYRRVLAPVQLITGNTIDAWMYYYLGALEAARLIRGGRYIRAKPL